MRPETLFNPTGYIAEVGLPGEAKVKVKPEVLDTVGPGHHVRATRSLSGSFLLFERTTAVILEAFMEILHLSKDSSLRAVSIRR